MLNSIAIYTKNDSKTKELYEFLNKIAPYPVYLNPDVGTVKKSIVFIDYYSRYFFNLSSDNVIIFLCRKDHLSASEILLLPILKTIVANTVYEAVQISWQIRHKHSKIQITHLLPWSTTHKITEGPPFYLALEENYRKAFFGQTIQNENPNTSVRIYLTDSDEKWPYSIIDGMLSGAIAVVPDRPPFNEFIINGHNGYLIRNPGDIVDALKGIKENKGWISHHAKATMNAIFNPTRYLESLMNIEQLPNINKFKHVPTNYRDRSWLIRERSFNNGKIEYYPEDFNPKFTLIDFDNVQEVLNYFMTQHFTDVYVFGCDFSETLEANDEFQLRRIISKMGSRSMKIHFCRDESIPKIWEQIFSKLSVISIEEGLKQITN